MAYTYGTTTYAKDSNGNYITLNGTYIYQIRLGYQVNSQDIENNKSNISLQLEVRSINSSYRTYGYNQTTTIDGTSLSAASFDFRSTNTWQIFGTRTFDVPHNADGTYSVEKSASFTTTATGTGRPHSGSASVQVTLPTIPRASAISVTDANIGSSTNITINKASSSFTTTLEYSTNNSTWTTIVNKTNLQVYPWTVPTSFYSLIPNAKTMTCYFRATTYSGNTNVGTKTTTATFTATGNPIINSCSLVSTDSTTINLVGASVMIRYISTVKATVSASGQNSATISSIKINNTTATNGVVIFTNADTYSYQVVVTDSRGYQASNTYAITWTNYIPLTLNATIKRNQPTDNKIKISYSGNYFNDSFRKSDNTYIANTLTVRYRAVERGNSFANVEWTSLSPTKSGNTYSQNDYVITTDTYAPSGYDYTKQYEFQIQAIDRVSNKPINGITVSKGTPVFNWDDDEFNVNVYTRLSSLAVVGDIYSRGFNMSNLLCKTVPNANLNDYTTPGIYYFTSGCTNAPMNWVYVLVMGKGPGDVVQIASQVSGYGLWYRKCNSGTWISWKKIAIDDSGSWTPTINTLEGAAPTMTYSTRRGNYTRFGDMVFVEFYIRGKITALNGTNNYALITGLPFWPKQLAQGELPLSKGTCYALHSNWASGTTFNVYRDTINNTTTPTIRIMDISGSGTQKLIVTSTNFFEVAGSGWYPIDTSM